jgi:hypothetical protein
MSEVILGFKSPIHFAAEDSIRLKGKQLVPVNLKSESVTLEWLEKHCKEGKQTSMTCSICGAQDATMTACCGLHGRVPHHLHETIDKEHLLSAAKKEAEK